MARATPSDKLTDANLDKVIGLLEAEKPITKKSACEILGIAYNTTRLSELIQKHKDKKAHRKAMVDSKRGKPATVDEMQDIVISYLQGESLTDIAHSNFRGTSFVKSVLDKLGVPLRSVDSDYWNPPMIPDEAVKRDFEIGERCYSARYQSLAKVIHKIEQNGEAIYRVWLESETQQQYAYQPWWELASLDLSNNMELNYKMNKTELIKAIKDAGDACINFISPVSGKEKYVIATLDFETKYIKDKWSKLNATGVVNDNTILVFSWDTDRFKQIEASQVVSVEPLSHMIPNQSC